MYCTDQMQYYTCEHPTYAHTTLCASMFLQFKQYCTYCSTESCISGLAERVHLPLLEYVLLTASGLSDNFCFLCDFFLRYSITISTTNMIIITNNNAAIAPETMVLIDLS